jgi:phosphatidylserine/phosphatidylglycerophosphate/cardiolipin synthase-like enzyme
VPPTPGPAGFKVRKLHHKTAVVDDRTVVAGSFNYTRPANKQLCEEAAGDETRGVAITPRCCS